MTTPPLDWLFVLLGWLLGAQGAAILLWALFRDRARGRRRCPCCWYDMAGTPGLTCPECGSAARDERRLFRTRRRWRWAAAGALLLLAGLGVAKVPAYRHGGWLRVLPASILVFVAPAEKPSGVAAPGAVVIRAGPGTRVVVGGPVIGGGPVITPGPPAAPPPTAPLGERLHDELWSRLTAGDLARWQSGLYLGRYFRANPADRPDRLLTLPLRWPAGTPLSVRGTSMPGGLAVDARLGGGDWTDVSTPGILNQGSWVHPLGPAAAATPGASLEVRLRAGSGRVVYGIRVPLSTVIGGSAADFLEPLDSPEHSELVLAALRPRVLRIGERLVLSYTERSSEDPWKRIDFGVYITAELRRGDRVLAAGAAATDWSENTWAAGLFGETLTPAAGIDAAALTGPHSPPLTLILRGDPARAGRAYLDSPFQRQTARCWTGTVAIPIDRIDSLPGPAENPGGGRPAGSR